MTLNAFFTCDINDNDVMITIEFMRVQRCNNIVMQFNRYTKILTHPLTLPIFSKRHSKTKQVYTLTHTIPWIMPSRCAYVVLYINVHMCIYI